MNKEEIENLFNGIPRVNLGFFPTPLYKAERISEELGINLYLKRDDITGPSVFGGNKIRKLEFLLGDAIKKGATHIITYGATQSNHAMQTAIASNILGLKPILYLSALVYNEGDLRSNLFLDSILDAEIHIIDLESGMTDDDGEEIGIKMAEEREKELLKEGKKAYEIPGGGSTNIGSLGFAKGFLELVGQVEEQEIGKIDYIFATAGSGGTLAGILAGRAIANCDCKVIGMGVSPKDENYVKRVISLANEGLSLLDNSKKVEKEGFVVDDSYAGKGYEIPSKEASNAIKYFARKEGIFLDPVYTGKTMAGLLDYVKKGIIPQNSNVIFWHTGGTTALFAENEIVGKLSD